jgi:hypothetical protein
MFTERGIGVIFPRSPRPFLGASLAAQARMGHARRGRCRMRSRLLYKKQPRGGAKTGSRHFRSASLRADIRVHSPEQAPSASALIRH